MRRCLLWPVALLCALAEAQNSSRSPHDARPKEDILADILSEVLRTSGTKDVLFMLRDSSSDGRANDILDKISATASGRVPTLYVNARQPGPRSRNSSRVLSRDLVVYAYVSERELDIVEGELIAEDIKRFVQERVRPKVLVLMVLQRASRDLTSFFHAIWSRRILDTIVVEYAERERTTIVRRYDPFADHLTEEPYSAEVAWFTADFPNMRGYPLTYVFGRRPPYSDIVPVTMAGQTLTPKGVDWMVIETLTDKMNFTGVPHVMTEYTSYHKTPNGTVYGVLPDLRAGKYDAFLNTLPMFSTSMGFTDTVFVENWCFVVPRLPVKQSFMDSTAVLAFLSSFLIVGIFWLFSRLMRLDSDRWHPVKIVGIMLASSFPSHPTRLCERIVFLSIFAACARYSSILFAELTSISLDGNRYVRFDRLEDLINSDLVLVTRAFILNIIVRENSVLERHIRKLGKEVVYATDTACLDNLLVYQNVSCFMEEGWARLAAVNNMRDGKTVLRTTKLCYLSPPVGYIFPKGSPYIRRVSDILLMLSEGGIRTKWHHDYLQNETKETSIEMDDRDETNFMFVGVFRPILYVLIPGYSISVLVFIGELIWKHFGVNLSGHRFSQDLTKIA